ncbi:hypothetical protein Y032_0799g2410 [Ancylostoma ceylanicum]|uniref:Apyrase n=1 Tax=Ancylostoma ceylanicum TaxID=53326 RepID=A0A016WDI3_9BILA|nr:hypothetical protein Y032_0799g2410 [Ancylostoma ceylanicum]
MSSLFAFSTVRFLITTAITHFLKDLLRWSNGSYHEQGGDDKLIVRKRQIIGNGNGPSSFDVLAITDMDVNATVAKWEFRAVTRNGILILSSDKKTARLDWDPSSDQNLISGFNYKGRGMELSDIAEYNGHILSPDDKTGLLFEIKNKKERRLSSEELFHYCW